jgi:hypothetical protein
MTVRHVRRDAPCATAHPCHAHTLLGTNHSACREWDTPCNVHLRLPSMRAKTPAIRRGTLDVRSKGAETAPTKRADPLIFPVASASHTSETPIPWQRAELMQKLAHEMESGT